MICTQFRLEHKRQFSFRDTLTPNSQKLHWNECIAIGKGIYILSSKKMICQLSRIIMAFKQLNNTLSRMGNSIFDQKTLQIMLKLS